jgi:citronellyl-CoA dehydrogenase
MQFTQEHEELKRTVERFVANEINPYVDEWEEAGIFPPTRCSRSWATSACSG